MSGKIIFITGTDTGVGKTVITGCLARFLADAGYSVITQKWVQTGSGSGIPPDIRVHLGMMGRKPSQVREYLPDMAPFSFRYPASPHLAARLEKRRVDPGRIIRSCRRLAGKFDFVLAEGAGGLMVPVTGSCTYADLLKKMGIPVIIVAGNKLGVINHSVLTAEALKSGGIRNLGFVFNNIFTGTPGIILRDNPVIVGKISGNRIFGVMNKAAGQRGMLTEFRKTGREILKVLGEL